MGPNGERGVLLPFGAVKDYLRSYEAVADRMTRMVDEQICHDRYGPRYGRMGLEARGRLMFLEVKGLCISDSEVRRRREKWGGRQNGKTIFLYDGSRLMGAIATGDDIDLGLGGKVGRVERRVPEVTMELELVIGSNVGRDKFAYRLGKVTGQLPRGAVHVRDLVLPVTQEEMLHAGEEIVRRTVYSYIPNDPRLHMATRDAVHSSVVLDWVLTRAAVEMGEYGYWVGKAREQTEADRRRMGWISEGGSSLLGKVVNERFGYPMVSEEYLDVLIRNLGQTYGWARFFRNGSEVPGAQELFEIVMLAYGQDHLGLTARLVECGEEVNGKSVPSGRRAIELGKQVLQLYREAGLESEIVRHHKPIADGVDVPSLLSYEVSTNFGASLNRFATGGPGNRLPVVVTATSLWVEGVLRRVEVNHQARDNKRGTRG